jgi:hypothetical protein
MFHISTNHVFPYGWSIPPMFTTNRQDVPNYIVSTLLINIRRFELQFSKEKWRLLVRQVRVAFQKLIPLQRTPLYLSTLISTID